MSRTATEDNVLVALDFRPRHSVLPAAYAALDLGGFLLGYDASTVGSALNLIPGDK